MIRNAGKEDLPFIYEMICLLERTGLDKAAFRDILMKQLDDPMYLCLVIEEEGELRGMVNMRFEDQLHHAAKVAEVTELFVREEYRSKGKGKELLERAVLEAKQRGCVRIELSSSNWRVDAHRFYQDNGFELSHVNLTYDLK